MTNELVRSRKLPVAVLAACCLLPGLQTLVAVQLQWLTAITYPALKAAMIIAPIAVWRWCRLGRANVLGRIGLQKTRLLVGALVGAAMAGVILAAYYGIFRGRVDHVAPLLIDKLNSLGLKEHYWSMVVVISFANSMLEEYYWRGFILSELLARVGRATACLIAGGLFGLHHVFAVLCLADGWLIALGVACTVAAGLVWAWMRVRGASLIDCYVSHIMADLAALWVGWDLISRAS